MQKNLKKAIASEINYAIATADTMKDVEGHWNIFEDKFNKDFAKFYSEIRKREGVSSELYFNNEALMCFIGDRIPNKERDIALEKLEKKYRLNSWLMDVTHDQSCITASEVNSEYIEKNKEYIHGLRRILLRIDREETLKVHEIYKKYPNKYEVNENVVNICQTNDFDDARKAFIKFLNKKTEYKVISREKAVDDAVKELFLNFEPELDYKDYVKEYGTSDDFLFNYGPLNAVIENMCLDQSDRLFCK